MSGAVARRVVVHGRVQGVFFRDSTRELAQARGLAGWVTNRDDGTVEALFEGEQAAVEEAVAWCREGPRDAVVERVDVEDASVEGLGGFRVR